MALKNDPGVATRFPVNRKDHTKEHPHGYLTPILKKLLNKTMKITDPEVQKVLDIKTGTKAELKKIIMLRYILNAVQGENPAIEGILDRIDGKLKANNGNKININLSNLIVVERYSKEKDASSNSRIGTTDIPS